MKKSKMASLAPIFYILVTLHLALLPVPQAGVTLYAQPSITWQRVYGGGFGRDACLSDSGNFIVVGYTMYNNGDAIYVLKLSPYGDTIWTKKIGYGYGNPGIVGLAVVSSGDGGCVLTGNYDTAFTVKLNAQGDIVWNKRYGGRDLVKCFDIIKTSDGGYIACGEAPYSYAYAGYALKVDSAGNLQWRKYYGSIFSKDLDAVVEAFGGGYMFIGMDRAFSGDSLKAYVMKTDPMGNELWDTTYKVFNQETIAQKIRKLSNGYLIGSLVWDSINSRGAAGFFKIDTSGHVYFSKVFPTTQNIWNLDLKIVNPNKYVYAMTIDSSPTNLDNGKAMITDSSGNVMHMNVYPPPSWTNATGISLWTVVPIDNGDFLFAGHGDFRIVMYDHVYAMRTDSALNAPPLSISMNNELIPGEFKLFQNYPNPFNSITKIKFLIPKQSKVELMVFDVLGRNINTLVSKTLSAGEYTVDFDGSNLASGVYFYRLFINEEYIEAKKLILIK